MARKFLSIVVLAAIAALIFAGVATAQETKTLYWQRYDVDISVLPDGNLRVTETQELVFTSGTFRYGQREINLVRMSGISDVTVREEGGPVYQQNDSGQPYTYSVSRSGDQIRIRYNFPASSDTRRTIVIGYTALGTLRCYPDTGVDQLFWKAIPAGNPFPTRTSVITLHVPPPATFTNYGVYGAQATASFQAGQSDATIRVQGPINPGTEVEAVAEWPHGIVACQVQPWQQQLDADAAARAEQEALRSRWGPVLDVGFLALGGLLAIGGPVLLYLWWYRKGRDAPVGLVADYLPEPPSDLPAGMAGTLMDESADMQDILATILDLARRGVLEIEEVQKPGFLGIGRETDFIYRLRPHSVHLRPYEQTLLDKLFGRNDQEVRLSELKNQFYTALPTLRKQLYEAVVAEGYFKESPEKTRTRFGCLGFIALAAAVGIGFVLSALFLEWSAAVLCVPVGLGVVAVGIMILARYMPRRTEKGADAVARWRAFKRYLQNLEKYTRIEEAVGLFDQYLPYAVAFGLEQSWIRKFAEVDAPAPTWWIPYGMPRPYYGGDFGGGVESGRVPGRAAPSPVEGGGPRPSLEGASRGLASSLAGMSAGLGTMLSSASRTLASAPSSSGGGGGFGGGGFSGGGGFGGGGSGGGGSSFG